MTELGFITVSRTNFKNIAGELDPPVTVYRRLKDQKDMLGFRVTIGDKEFILLQGD